MSDEEDEDLENDKKNFGKIGKLRDDVTEGYNIIPNFFISATLDKELSYKDDIKLTEKKNKYFTSLQFKNRLFDRDTLLVSHYDVNFLFVVALYARNNAFQKRAWKDKVRKMFREQIQKMLTEKYDFYAMEPRPMVDGKAYIKEHFQDVLGKLYAPYKEQQILSLALDKTDPEGNNKTLLNELKDNFYVVKCNLGEDPAFLLPKPKEGEPILPSDSSEQNVLTGLIRASEKEFPSFYAHQATSCIIERIPTNVNLIGVKYYLPMVRGAIDGYYDVERLNFGTRDGNLILRLRLGNFHPIGDKWIQIYRTKMQPGELISLDYTMRMYNE
jgi:hypothetical protein